ncbi:DUF3990 domain-containing protein [Affinibrenneria salicis]|uniref:DUF3990 domain-containing protein n=1 Tax=Affinibrenneria salicis TaxID=2590031 RepID=UPI001CC6498A|nr:DUF3990 domain-containing protein [Affinibrenneria salicis]
MNIRTLWHHYRNGLLWSSYLSGRFYLSVSKLAKLDIKVFDSANGGWADFVTHARKGTLSHSHDAASGPMLLNLKDLDEVPHQELVVLSLQFIVKNLRQCLIDLKQSVNDMFKNNQLKDGVMTQMSCNDIFQCRHL